MTRAGSSKARHAGAATERTVEAIDTHALLGRALTPEEQEAMCVAAGLREWDRKAYPDPSDWNKYVKECRKKHIATCKEISAVNFSSKIASASMSGKPVEEQAALLQYALPKAGDTLKMEHTGADGEPLNMTINITRRAKPE